MHQHWALSLGLLGVVLQLLGHEATPNAYGDHYYNNASVRQLRFHDFEPREESVVRDEGERRQARGFHFNASGEDVSVEMEFIIPMVKVPVKRSMQLARDAVQGLLNLRATALLNTALVVAAGAIIAGVVRLVLAPLVFTTLSSANGYGYGYGNGYGYSAKQHESRRGMRSLTQVLESQLDAHSIDVSVCAQRAICHYLQQNAAQLHMQFLYLITTCLILSSCVAAESEETQHDGRGATASSSHKQQKSNQGFRLISFDSVDKDLALGLNYLMPFVEVPIKRKPNAPPRPLVIVNSAAILSCGLVAAGGFAVGHLIRSMGLETIVPAGKSETAGEHAERRLLDEKQSFLQLFDNFKLIYRNASGERVETGLPSLLSTIERTFLENDINLPVCLLKSICTLTHRAGESVRSGQASDLELMVDGAANWSWLLSWLEQSALRQAIEAGRTANPNYCTYAYPQCKWKAPEEQLLELLRNNVRFK
ncbi:uncharacterized protein LOC108659063 [Drosophila navojoa]|uniref:uncharacterized protein LOC108659063 n=1 Tax=Drosophila navojoa TaxID=7232 RepID=UPI0008476743|nr:uncharacterized protein LOC108659063 [Drosophila navojoa]